MPAASQVRALLGAPLRLADGSLVRARLAYASEGPADAPTYLLLHGYSGSHYALDTAGPASDAGWAAAWAGPGRVLDTRHMRVLCLNLPGSAYGSSWCGAEAAYASVANMADAVCALLDALGIAQLEGVIGYSFGGYVALQLRADAPQRVRRALALCSARRGRGSHDELPALRGLLEPEQRRAFRVATLMKAGLSEWARDRGAQALQQQLDAVRQWSHEFNASALWRLRAAALGFGLAAWPSESALLQASSDSLFPLGTDRPDQAHTVHTPYGHQALLLDPGPWCAPIGQWLAGRPFE
jgi:pimeloyl-ACP methyl ester carboxylesterase